MIDGGKCYKTMKQGKESRGWNGGRGYWDYVILVGMGSEGLSGKVTWEQRSNWKVGVRCAAVWEKSLPYRGHLGSKWGGYSVYSRNIKEAGMDKVQRVWDRIMEMKSEGSEEAKLWRALEVMIRTSDFILSEMKSHWCILIGEMTILFNFLVNSFF